MGLFKKSFVQKSETEDILTPKRREELISETLSKRERCTSRIDELVNEIKQEGGFITVFDRIFGK